MNMIGKGSNTGRKATDASAVSAPVVKVLTALHDVLMLLKSIIFYFLTSLFIPFILPKMKMLFFIVILIFT